MFAEKISSGSGSDPTPTPTSGRRVLRLPWPSARGWGVTVLDQGSNDGEVESSDFWGYLLGKVTAMGMFKKTLNVREADGLDSKVTLRRVGMVGERISLMGSVHLSPCSVVLPARKN